jgi:hypothetical protein
MLCRREQIATPERRVLVCVISAPPERNVYISAPPERESMISAPPERIM